MNHMSLPDENFQALLAEYAEDTIDNGFSDIIIAQISAQSLSETRIRRYGLFGACVVGGLIAGTQLLKLSEILDGTAVTEAFSTLPVLPLAAAIFIPLTVWLLEQREISL